MPLGWDGVGVEDRALAGDELVRVNGAFAGYIGLGAAADALARQFLKAYAAALQGASDPRPLLVGGPVQRRARTRCF